MKSTFAIILCLIFLRPAHGQMFGIGTSAGLIKVLVERSTRAYNQCDTCGRKPGSHRNWDVRYSQDTIVDVIQCYQQEYLPECKSIASYCEHYMMDRGKLAYVLTHFDDISLKKISTCYDRDPAKHKIGKLYFSPDYERYSKLYSSGKGGSTVIWRRTIISELPQSIQDTVYAQLTAARKATEKRKAEALEKAKREQGDVGYSPAAGSRKGGMSIGHAISGRSIMSRPGPDTNPAFREGGKVVFRVTIDRDGYIIHSRVISAANTDIRNAALKHIQNVRFNPSLTAPAEQFGTVTFQFRVAVTK